MLISDFGLCRKLELDQTSFLPTTGGAMGVGTFGWRAPEILRGEVKLDEPLSDDNNSQSSRGSVGTATGSNPTTRLTKSVDIFALGCLYYYCQTNGGHPFGDRYEREVNIIRDHKSLQGLEGFGEEGSEAVDLINAMLAPEAADRCAFFVCISNSVSCPDWWVGGPTRRRVSCIPISGTPVVVWGFCRTLQTASRSCVATRAIHTSSCWSTTRSTW